MENKMILVKGDVSGIQEFIFNVKSKGAASELKGRSFFIKLLLEVTIRRFLNDFNVNKSDQDKCKVSTSGGNFILKLPYHENYRGLTELIKKDVTNSIQFTGLNMSIGSLELTSFKTDIARLNLLCRKAKFEFYGDDLNYFLPIEKVNIKVLNENWAKITSLMRTSKSFLIEKETGAFNQLVINEKKISFLNYEISFLDNENGIPLRHYLESLFPLQENNEPKKFEHLVESDVITQGNQQHVSILGGKEAVKKLGVIAFDVDGLGTLIESIKTEEILKELDEKLREFFNIRIRLLINDKNIHYETRKVKVPLFENKIYSVTAGGDDSFFVGKWNTILDFAIKINQEFTLIFEKENLTMSAGLIIVDPKFPVIRFADLVESSLKKAKYSSEEKGNICLLGEVIRWRTLDEVVIMRDLLLEQLARKGFTKGLLAKARLSATQIQEYNKFKLEDFWKFGYFLRNVAAKDKEKIMKKIEGYIEIALVTSSKIERKSYRTILPLAARLAELHER